MHRDKTVRATYLNLNLWICCLAFFCGMPSNAMAIDCKRASSLVEKTICRSTELLAQDEELLKTFKGALNRSDVEGELSLAQSEKNILIDQQRSWLVSREAQCGKVGSSKIDVCVSKSTKSRIAAIAFEWRGEVVWSADRKSFVLGENRVDVVKNADDPETGPRSYMFNGDVLASDPGMRIERGYIGDGLSAVLLASPDMWSGHCSQFTVLESRGSKVTAHDLGSECISLDNGLSVSRIQNGFEASTFATPYRDGDITTWTADGGLKFKRAAFVAHPTLKMSDLLADGHHASAEPSDIIEFNTALQKLSDEKQSRIMRSLWDVSNGCDGCGADLRRELYGAHVGKSAVIFSGCGQYMQSGSLLCSQDDALALYSRTENRFYFALAPHKDDGIHPYNEILLYPDLSSWPEAFRDNLNDWSTGKSVVR